MILDLEEVRKEYVDLYLEYERGHVLSLYSTTGIVTTFKARNSPDGNTIVYDCSCPAGPYCPHVGAVRYRWRNRG